jgi:hypothetical protein
VHGIAPAAGGARGGEALTITGSGFASGATVRIGGRSAFGVVVVDGTTITAEAPPAPGAFGDVNGSGSATSVDALCILRFVAALPATQGCPQAGLTSAADVVVTNPDGQGATLAAGYAYAAPPYAATYRGKLYLYGVAGDGNLYARAYDGNAYGPPQQVNGGERVGAYQPYAVDYGGYANIFYVTQDGKGYWNRYDGTAYTGAKALPGSYTFGYAPYAVGYPADQKLYVYAVSTDGIPYYNVFTPGQGFSGYTAYQTPPPAKVKYQPSAYVYQGAQHVVYTGEDGHAYYTSYQNGEYSGFSDLGANYAYTPIQYEYGGKYYLTYTGQDGYVYYKTYSGGGQVAPPYTPTPSYGGGYGPTPTPTPGY